MSHKDIVERLREKFDVDTVQALKAVLGISNQRIQNWRDAERVTDRQIVDMVYRAYHAGAENAQLNAIRPLVEFFPIERCESRRRKKYEIFPVGTRGRTLHRYKDELYTALRSNKGVYVFFDSRGRAVYVGKTLKQNLWLEMNAAFNRRREQVLKIKRVKHPSQSQPYRTYDEKQRQIDEYAVPLYELVNYFSAYRVDEGLIDHVEAMLVRSFANDLLDIRMERFA